MNVIANVFNSTGNQWEVNGDESVIIDELIKKGAPIHEEHEAYWRSLMKKHPLQYINERYPELGYEEFVLRNGKQKSWYKTLPVEDAKKQFLARCRRKSTDELLSIVWRDGYDNGELSQVSGWYGRNCELKRKAAEKVIKERTGESSPEEGY